MDYSFFILGVLLLFVRSKDSNLFFANKIWLLGLFAILHAFVEWIACINIYILIQKKF